ncbi:MAG: hypothetical protein VX181_17385, partial [Pseudomonadota bacterium]|nr:hypothetical protein [Pseudomonadota bacterium]
MTGLVKVIMVAAVLVLQPIATLAATLLRDPDIEYALGRLAKPVLQSHKVKQNVRIEEERTNLAVSMGFPDATPPAVP